MQQKQSAKVMIVNKKRARNTKILTIIKATVLVFIIVGICIKRLTKKISRVCNYGHILGTLH